MMIQPEGLLGFSYPSGRKGSRISAASLGRSLAVARQVGVSVIPSSFYVMTCCVPETGITSHIYETMEQVILKGVLLWDK